MIKRDLSFEIWYQYPPEVVWRAITDSAAIAEWLMANDFEPRVGHKFQFRSDPQPGWDGIVNGEVIEVEEPRRLAYTWRGGPLDTILTITLEPEGEGTRMRLDHSGFKGFKALMVSFILGSGWKGIVHKHLPAVLARMEARASEPEAERDRQGERG